MRKCSSAINILVHNCTIRTTYPLKRMDRPRQRVELLLKLESVLVNDIGQSGITEIALLKRILRLGRECLETLEPGI